MSIEINDLKNNKQCLVDITNAESSEICGGGAGAAGGAVASILDNKLNGKKINWKSAGAWAIGGAIAGSPGGLVTAALAG
jgi:hypothetical protein